MERVIGIDLGTTNACVAVVESGVPMVIPTAPGQTRLPAVLTITEQGKRLVGQLAKRQAVVSAEHTASALKRLIGRKFASSAVRQIVEMVPYRVIAGPGDEARILLRSESYAVPELCATLLLELKRTVEGYLHEPVSKAVLTVPPYFSDAQRQALKEAARLAGIEVVRLLSEPIAAAIAYGLGGGETKVQRVVVYDLGGGTFDFSLLDLRAGAFEVRATSSDLFLGGDDFDRRLLDYLVFGFAKDHKIDLRQDRTALQRLRDAVERAKIELSVQAEVTIEVPFIISTGTSEPLHLKRVITRAKLEELTEDLIERTAQLCRQSLAEVGVERNEIDAVILVGGMAHMPRVVQTVTELFGRTPLVGIGPEDVLAIGGALQGAAMLSAPQHAAATYDACPQALGLLVAGGQRFPLIEAGAALPCERRYVFTTARDEQTGLRLVVVRGEARSDKTSPGSSRSSVRGPDPVGMSGDDVLGELLLEGLAPGPRGAAEVEVCFSVAASGQLTVTATDLFTGQQRSMTAAPITPIQASRLRTTAGGSTYALELSRDEEFVRAQQRTERLISEILGMLPRAEQVVSGSELGLDAMRRARAIVERAKIAIIRGEPVALLDAQDVLERTATMLRGVTQALRIS